MGPSSVAVVIAARNADATIERAILSAAAESEVKEIIVVDDASTDDTARIAANLPAARGKVRVISLGQNRGPAAARNMGIEVASAPLVSVLDGDDYLLPGRFARLLSFPLGWDAIADDIIITKGDESPEVLQPFLMKHVPAERLSLTSFVKGNLPQPGRMRHELGYLKPVFRRKFLLDKGLRYDESLRLGEDFAFYVQALRAGADFRVAPACGYVAVVMAGSLSQAHGAKELARLHRFESDFARRESHSHDEIQALERHRSETYRKLAYREVLDAWRNRDVVTALRWAFSNRSVPAYIARETVKAKAMALGLKQAPELALPRLLIGAPISPASA